MSSAIAPKRRTLRGALVAGTLVAFATLGIASTAAAQGDFVIGDQNAAVGSAVTFWGAQWWKDNGLSGGSAPASFKGFANSLQAPPACGVPWTSDPGNSSEPPAGPLPGLIEVIVSSNITKSGRAITGDAAEVVLVATNPGYEGNPGHPGTGTVVGVLCRAGGNGGGPVQ
jgi:hypothetical protein